VKPITKHAQAGLEPECMTRRAWRCAKLERLFF
jgi:hypothetical protein